MTKNTIILSVAFLLTTFTACSNNPNKETTSATTVQQTTTDSNAAQAEIIQAASTVLPAFALEEKNGNTINLQSFIGKKVFVNLWASWCPPCRAEIPSIQKLAQSVDTSKVAFVMLSLDETFDKAKQFAKLKKMTLRIYYPAENLPDIFNVPGIPSTFIFDESGKLIQRVEGADNYNTKQYKELLK